jgi:hypothetical protein
MRRARIPTSMLPVETVRALAAPVWVVSAWLLVAVAEVLCVAEALRVPETEDEDDAWIPELEEEETVPWLVEVLLDTDEVVVVVELLAVVVFETSKRPDCARIAASCDESATKLIW